MKRITLLLLAIPFLAGVVAFTAFASRRANQEAAPLFVKTIPPGYRDWRLISVAHEEGELNDIRAILGNDVAIKAYREAKLPFPDGTIIARLAWSHDASEENNKTFGRPQSFVAGAPKNGIQFMVKDSKKYDSVVILVCMLRGLVCSLNRGNAPCGDEQTDHAAAGCASHLRTRNQIGRSRL